MPVSTTDVTLLSASQLARSIAAGERTAAEIIDAHIARIEEVNPRLNAVVVSLFDDARKQAQEADRTPAEQRGPLHGVPVTVKECFDVAGTPSTAGLTSRSAHRAATDAPLVSALRRAGAIILGKTNVSQMLMYVETDNPIYGRTNNPWNLERSAGGSSGGEGAIVAARGSALGLGTDIGGSVRVPAHCCGVHSFKPTPGRLSVAGTVDIIGPAARAAVPDSAGLIARHVDDLRLGFDVLSPSTAPTRPTRDMRIGFYEDDGYFPASLAIRRAVRAAADTLRERGLQVVPFSPPDVAEALSIFYALFSSDGGKLWRDQLAGGAVDPHLQDLLMLAGMPNLARPAMAGVLRLQGQRTLARTLQGSGKANADQVAALVRRRDAYRQRFGDAMQAAGVDVLLCPPSGVPAFRHGTARQLGPASVNYTCLYNLLGYPAGVVSTTRVRDDETSGRARSREAMVDTARAIDDGSAGLPVGVQVAARAGNDDSVLAVMRELEGEASLPVLT